MKLSGIAASDGVGIGRVYLAQEADTDYSGVSFTSAENEKERLSSAIDAFCVKTEALFNRTKENVGEKEAGILAGQMSMVKDPFMLSQMNDMIDTSVTAEAAVDTVCGMFIEMFSGVDDELTKQRAADIADLRRRLLLLLLGRHDLDLAGLPKNSVIIAHDFTPSMTVGIDVQNVAAIVAECGGMTSHSAILARALGLPAVLGCEGALSSAKDGENIIVDGGEGTVIISPDENELKEYENRQKSQLDEKNKLSAFIGAKTQTADNKSVDLYANIGSPSDLDAVMQNDAEGIGLFRSEFLFMDRTSMPSEEEQLDAYKKVASAMGDKEVIIRTLDVGGDKEIVYLGLEKEENPFLGYRAIRLCLGNRQMFKTQLRALLRAAVYGNIKIMLPLISTLDELNEAKELIEECKRELKAENLPFKEVPVGIMVETPSAALCADLLAKEADFFSIGTNDLTGYTMAADRGNKKVQYLYSAYNIAVIRSIKQVISAAKEAKIPVGMCGEAAGDPLMIPLLIAFGLDEYSVSATSVLRTRKIISQWSKEDADRLAGEVMKLTSASEIYEYLKANAKC